MVDYLPIMHKKSGLNLNTAQKLGLVHTPTIPALGNGRRKDHKFRLISDT